MNLVLFTSHFPFGRGEEFLEPEFSCMVDLFDSVVVVSNEKNPGERTRLLPSGVRLVTPRKGYSRTRRLKHFLREMINPAFYREFGAGIKERGFGSFAQVLSGLLLCRDSVHFLKESEEQWLDMVQDDTVFYSYWLSDGSVYLTDLKRRLPVVCISRAHGADCFFERGYSPYRYQVLQMLDYIFPISDAGREDLILHYSAKHDEFDSKILVSHLGINQLPETRSRRRNEKVFHIVSCSRVIPLKRLDLMIDALRLIDGLSLVWTHFGDGPLLEEICERAQLLQEGGRVSVRFAGSLSHEGVLSAYETSNYDCFVNCSDAEGISVAAMEAMSYGIPVVCRDVGGMRELVDSEVGRLLPQDATAMELADAIASVLECDEEEWRSMSCRARDRVERDFFVPKNVAAMFNTVLNG